MPPTDKFVTFDGMVWPNPSTIGAVEYSLRYNVPPSRSDMVIAASVISAYRHLIELPQAKRNERIKAIRIASATAPEALPKSVPLPVSTSSVEARQPENQGAGDGQSPSSGGEQL